MGNVKNKIGFKVKPRNKKKGKSGKGSQKSKTGKELGFKGGRGRKATKTKKGWSYKTKITEPKDTKRFDKMSIVFFDSKVLNEITKKCLPKAGGSEFQVHYRALNIHIERGDFEVALAIPTAYYNFKQEVSSGSVDYELDDIDNEAEAVRAASEANVKDLLAKLPLFDAMNNAGYKVTFKEGNFGSIHRHPGRFGFSSIDLGKDPESPGVIYRQRVAKDFFQTDSVMYINGSECEIYTTEARIVNLEKAADGGVDGDYCQIPTISIIRPEESEKENSDPAFAVLGEVDQDIFSKFHFVGAFGAEIKKYPMLEAILEMLDSLEYNACIDNVDPERIEQKYSYLKGGVSKKYGNHGGYGNGYESYHDAFGGYDDYWDMYYEGLETPASKAGKAKDFDKYKDKNVTTFKDDDSMLTPTVRLPFEETEIAEMIELMFAYHGVECSEEEYAIVDKILKEHFTVTEQYEILEYAADNAASIYGNEEADLLWNGW